MEQQRSEPTNPHISKGSEGERNSQYTALALKIGRSEDSAGKSLRLLVTSASMLPLIHPGDSIHMEYAAAKDLKFGDIIVFRKGNYLVTHRLLVFNRHGFRTKGDALTRFDPLVVQSDLVGRVVGIEQVGKYINLTAQRWQSFNRWAGLVNLWQARAAQLGDWLFPRYRSSPGGAGLPLIARGFSSMLRVLLKILLKALSL